MPWPGYPDCLKMRPFAHGSWRERPEKKFLIRSRKKTRSFNFPFKSKCSGARRPHRKVSKVSTRWLAFKFWLLLLARISHWSAKRGRADARRYKASSRAPLGLSSGRRQPSGARETKRTGVLESTSSALSECNAVDSGRCTPATVGW